MLRQGKLTGFGVPRRKVDFSTLNVIEEWINEAAVQGTR